MSAPALRHGNKLAVASMALACSSSACEPELVVGTWTCPAPALTADGGTLPSLDKIVDVPWNTGFETEFCEYDRAGGFCYASAGASFEIVTTPVHGGRGAAAFSVTTDPTRNAGQSRCFREGTLPGEAVYGAWFHLPALADDATNWNLMHFQGGLPGDLHGLWDVSLRATDDGGLFLYVYDFLRGRDRTVPDAVARTVPIGSWFHVELRLRRARDNTGEVALYQDGVLLLQIETVSTDDTDFGQWYVGNLVDTLAAPESIVYVDDVTIRPAP